MNPCLEFGMWGNVGIIKAIRISFIMKKELYQVYSEYWTLDIVLLYEVKVKIPIIKLNRHSDESCRNTSFKLFRSQKSQKVL